MLPPIVQVVLGLKPPPHAGIELRQPAMTGMPGKHGCGERGVTGMQLGSGGQLAVPASTFCMVRHCPTGTVHQSVFLLEEPNHDTELH
jgi:hypothetical protein